MTPRKITHIIPRETVEVEIDGVTETYELREMNALSHQQWQDSHRERTNYIEKDGKIVAAGIKTTAGAYGDLLSRCLWKDGKLVPLQIINAFPVNVADDLYSIAIEVNRIGKDEPPKD